ncbi:MAG: DUF4236 domain-containing protein [Cyclobacteriaceae bacterium]
MGWGFRKSARFGPFRINFSKTGISSSIGVKGARVSFGKSGTYLNLGAKGFYYRKKISGNKRKTKKSDRVNSSKHVMNQQYSNPLGKLTDKESVDFIQKIYEYQSKSGNSTLYFIVILFSLIFLLIYLNTPTHTQYEDYSVFTITSRRINIRTGPGTDYPILAKGVKGQKFEIIAIDSLRHWTKISHELSSDSVGYIYSPLGVTTQLQRVQAKTYPLNLQKGMQGLFWMVIVVGVVLLWRWVINKDKQRKSFTLNYVLNDRIAAFHNHFLNGFQTFKSSNLIWEQSESITTEDKRYHAGADSLVKRKRLTDIIPHKLPYEHLITNVTIPCIISSGKQYYFLPERMVIKQDCHFAGILYKNLTFEKQDIKFIENEKIAEDAEIIDYTWQFTNKFGDRDRRFKDNRKLPICRYSEYRILSDSGLKLILHSSKINAMNQFMESLKFIAHYQKDNLS